MEELILTKSFITLGQLLQVSGFAGSGAEAKILVKELTITVNQETENRRGRKLYAADVVTINGQRFLIKQ